MYQLEQGQLHLGPISYTDFMHVLKKTKPSVGPEDII